MASRAEPVPAPVLPPLGGVVRAAASDFYFHSLRLIPLNLVWGLGVIAAGLLSLVWPVGALVLALLLALPTAAVFRMAATIARGASDATVADAFATSMRSAGPVVLVGAGFVGATVVLGTNTVIGLTQTSWLGWSIGTLAAWGLVALWCAALVVWPLLVDPQRAGQPARRRLRTAGLVLLAFPMRSATLGVMVGVVAALSTVLVVALLSVGVAVIALLACRGVYPLADRVEARSGAER